MTDTSSNEYKRTLLQNFISTLDDPTGKKEKDRINLLTCSFNKKEKRIIIYYDAITNQQISYEEYERRYYKFVLLKDIKN